MEGEIAAYDAIIIGAGPAGLACAIEFYRHNLRYLVIEKGCLVNTVYHYPANLTLFSTPDLLEIGDVPFIISSDKPRRKDLLGYYRGVTERFGLDIRLFEKVYRVTGQAGAFRVETDKAGYDARCVIIATGQYDNPNRLGIPGGDLPKVSHYYTEGHPHYNRNVAVIGGKNSAVEIALDLYRHGAKVTIIHRGPDFGESVKYWIKPDIENRIREGKITALFNTSVTEITEIDLRLQDREGKSTTIANDVVFAMTGYHIDNRFLRSVGIEIAPDSAPVHDPDSLETNIPGIYIAGVLTAGAEGSKVFIENSRTHGKQIIGHLLNGTKQ